MPTDATDLLTRDTSTSAQDLDIVVSGPPQPSRRRGLRLVAAVGTAVGLAVAAWLGLLLPALLIAVLVVGLVLLVPQLQIVLEQKRSREEREGEAMANWFANLRVNGTWSDIDAPTRPRARSRSAGRHRATP